MPSYITEFPTYQKEDRVQEIEYIHNTTPGRVAYFLPA
jgi:hypothetical protein